MAQKKRKLSKRQMEYDERLEEILELEGWIEFRLEDAENAIRSGRRWLWGGRRGRDLGKSIRTAEKSIAEAAKGYKKWIDLNRRLQR
jgi:hypothetical protein